MTAYEQFLASKTHYSGDSGFNPIESAIPSTLFDFQKYLVEWACRKGRGAVFADCGLGKTPVQLSWADQVVRKTTGKVLILTPLAVSHQTIKEGEKFGIECTRSHDGKPAGSITVTNYERLHLFDQSDYVGVVCDESSILKNYDGTRRAIITEFMRQKPYRLLCTATAAPNDYTELGTSAEALGTMGHMDMLGMFFRNDRGSVVQRSKSGLYTKSNKWRFKKHGEVSFWKWVCSWARAVRKPSDLGFSDGDFMLPPIEIAQTVIENLNILPGELFVKTAIGWREQRAEMRATIKERCEKVAEIVDHNRSAVVWCHLNSEGDLLSKLIPGAVQVSGRDSDEQKEQSFNRFSSGDIRVLITKPKIGAFGLNWQHCAHMTFFPSHSYEQFYQAVRRCWRFGQKKPVRVDVVTTTGGSGILGNLQKKSTGADEMFRHLVEYMTDSMSIDKTDDHINSVRIPSWA